MAAARPNAAAAADGFGAMASRAVNAACCTSSPVVPGQPDTTQNTAPRPTATIVRTALKAAPVMS